MAIPVFHKLLKRWPTPFALSQGNIWLSFSAKIKSLRPADESELANFIHCLGTHNLRAKRLIKMSRMYLHDKPSPYDPRRSRATLPPGTPGGKRVRYPDTPISHLPGIGVYALDSYRIFCYERDYPGSQEWKEVMPTDKELIRYLVRLFIAAG